MPPGPQIEFWWPRPKVFLRQNGGRAGAHRAENSSGPFETNSLTAFFGRGGLFPRRQGPTTQKNNFLGPFNSTHSSRPHTPLDEHNTPGRKSGLAGGGDLRINIRGKKTHPYAQKPAGAGTPQGAPSQSRRPRERALFPFGNRGKSRRGGDRKNARVPRYSPR